MSDISFEFDGPTSHPPRMKKPEGLHLTIRDVAKAAGCSHSSVSRALRGEPRVSPELRARVKRIAEEMGYRPNPFVSSLMGVHNKRAARKNLVATIAWLNTHPNKQFWHQHSYSNRCLKAAQERALQIGFGFDEIWVSEPNMTAQRFEEILSSRGINGLIVSRSCNILKDLEIDTSKHIIVAVGARHSSHCDWHRACPSSRLNMEKAFSKIRDMGYKRIGYAIPVRDVTELSLKKFNEGALETNDVIRSEDALGELAGFHLCQQFIKPENRILPFAYDRDDEDSFVSTLADWINRSKVDAIVTSDGSILKAAKLAGRKVPHDLAIAHLNLSDDEEGWAGIDINPEEQAEAAIDMLSGMIQRNQRGIPKSMRYVHTQGKWQDGWTVPLP